jgi:hypothetical protein
MLAFLSMHCRFSLLKFHKLRWASTLNQKHLFVITSLSTTQFEYGVKFSMEIQIFRKIMEFMLTLAITSPSFMLKDEHRSSMGEGSLHHLWQMLCEYYVAESSEEQKQKKWKMKKNYYDEKKRKVRKKGRITKRERQREKWEKNKIKLKK